MPRFSNRIYSNTSTGTIARNVENGISDSTNLTELNDVDITTPTNGQHLAYDATLGKWENVNPAGGTDVYDGVNKGTGAQVFINKTSPGPNSFELNFKTLKSSAGIQWFGDADTLTPTINLTSFPSGLDATKISTGLITNTEFNFLNNVSSKLHGEADSAIYTNKTLDDDSNNIRANSLKVDGTTIPIDQTTPPNNGALVYSTLLPQQLTFKTLRGAYPLVFGAGGLSDTINYLLVGGNIKSPVASQAIDNEYITLAPFTGEINKLTYERSKGFVSGPSQLVITKNDTITYVFTTDDNLGQHIFITPIPVGVNDNFSIKQFDNPIPPVGYRVVLWIEDVLET